MYSLNLPSVLSEYYIDYLGSTEKRFKSMQPHWNKRHRIEKTGAGMV